LRQSSPPAPGSEGDIAIVAHGGAGTLLLCHLRGHAIGHQHDQPPNNGGDCFAFDARTRRLHCGWKAIDGPSPQRSPRAMWVAAGK
jgi:broad specificity phosphatase PhoE